MPGVLKLEGTNIATGDGNGAVTINNATLGSAVTIPASIGGTMVFLEKFTASNTSAKLFNLDSFTPFDSYLIRLHHVKPASDNVRLHVNLGTSSSSFRENNGDYEDVQNYAYYNGSTGGETWDSATAFIAHASEVSSDSGTGVSGNINIYDPLDSSVHTNSTYEFSFVNYLSRTIISNGSGTNLATLDDAYIKFQFSNSANIASGTISLYGIRNA